MSFFSEIYEIPLFEENSDTLSNLEEKESMKLLKVFKRARQELRDRLDILPSGTFTSQQVRGVLLQIEMAIREIENNLVSQIEESGKTVTSESIKDLSSEINKLSKYFDGAVVPIDIDSILQAMDTQDYLINRHESSIRTYGAGLRQQITTGLLDAVAQEKTNSQIVSDISKFFIGEEWRLQRIARTELHYIYNMSKTSGMVEVKDQYIPDLKRALYHPMDARTANDSKYANRLNLVAEVNEPFSYRWKGETRTFFSPPDRANDRSVIVPYTEQWDK